MYVITYKGKPVTADRVEYRERNLGPYKASLDNSGYFTGRTKKAAIDALMYAYGFTWAEWRKEGYGVIKLVF